MFLLFRSIRRNFIENNKLLKYCLYAAGEILLVVIGILIALTVNNRNIENQNALLEQQYYQTIQEQLREDRGLLEVEIDKMKERKNLYLQALEIIGTKDFDKNKVLAGAVYQLLGYEDFRRISSAYQTLQFSGEIKHIKNTSVINGLQEIERTYQITERLENIQKDIVNMHHSLSVLRALDLSALEIVNPDLIFNTPFANRFITANSLIDEKTIEFNRAIDAIDNTLSLITEELN